MNDASVTGHQWLYRRSIFGLLFSVLTLAGGAQASAEKVKVALIGDSTQTAQAGYGRGFCANLTAEVECMNLSRGGASTKTYRTLGLWDKALQAKPDYMVIQFGHNDMEEVDGVAKTERQVSLAVYEENLRKFIAEAKAAGIKPVLVTPLAIRHFTSEGKVAPLLDSQSTAMTRVAKDLQVPLIDLHGESVAYLNKAGITEASKLFITNKNADGSNGFDEVHINWAGSYLFGRMVAAGLGQEVPALKKYVVKDAAALPPQGARAMKIIAGGPVKIVLVGDASVAAKGGWGAGFCRTVTPNVSCVNLAVEGNSAKATLDNGTWTKALAEHGDFYLIGFGDSDQAVGHKDADTTFVKTEQKFIEDAKAQGAVPITVTPMARRNYANGKVVDDLTTYSKATKWLSGNASITAIDLYALSMDLLNRMTPEQAAKYDVDATHLNDEGQTVFGRMVADNVMRTQVELGPNIRGEAAGKSVIPVIAIRQAAPTDGMNQK